MKVKLVLLTLLVRITNLVQKKGIEPLTSFPTCYTASVNTVF